MWKSYYHYEEKKSFRTTSKKEFWPWRLYLFVVLIWQKSWWNDCCHLFVFWKQPLVLIWFHVDSVAKTFFDLQCCASPEDWSQLFPTIWQVKIIINLTFHTCQSKIIAFTGCYKIYNIKSNLFPFKIICFYWSSSLQHSLISRAWYSLPMKLSALSSFANMFHLTGICSPPTQEPLVFLSNMFEM